LATVINGLKVGKDFFLCFSPERVDPGNPHYQTRNIPKVVGGVTPACTMMGTLFYSHALETVIPVSSTQVAEMVKLLENTFRMINIGLVNEMAVMCERMGINVWEVIDAAASKPFGFPAILSGTRLGRTLYSDRSLFPLLEDAAGRHGSPLHRTGGYINGQMPHFVVEKIQNALNDRGKPLKGLRIHVLGVLPTSATLTMSANRRPSISFIS